ncbi:carbohydrate ABC transporter permease [Occultella aeris]|uniref:L-arabinose transport system permease protein AraQ n=1 Tax=Occultella aeris TaxID=2761496 RepID=A0A7M4DRV3_9MICO|nr:carbohydrate ABC transporter permease [Occultella aeris]VZO40197.1 L-arabinose transport system permease protein AraQ [Occultella aeris]
MTNATTQPATVAPTPPRRRRARPEDVRDERSIISTMDRKSPLVRGVVAVAGGLLLVALVITCAGPLFWLFKAATSTSTETLAQPFGLWPSGLHWENVTAAWSTVRFGTYLRNTLIICAGSWFFGLLVATTGGYGIAVLRPAYAKVVEIAVLATLFIPGVISLVALYLTVVNLPLLNVNLLNTFWAVWLPASASAFNVLLVSRYFQAIPRELFEAARIDGAGAFRVFWSLVLPLAKPILGVVSLLTIIGAYKDFLWPLLALPDHDLQPISVALPRVESSTDLGVFMAALFISVVIPVALFLAFQRQFLRAAGSAGAIKG